MKTITKTIFLLLLFVHEVKAQKITDTIFFNPNWEICEKEMAVYYRIGTLAIDSFWFYTGNIKDYDLKHTLLMEANYSEDGYKNGPFKYYYPDGRLMIKGEFKEDEPTGNWYYYYNNDSLQAIINFDKGQNDFVFHFYKSEKGKTLLENGTGNFEWVVGEKNSFGTGYVLNGSFKNEQRDGAWKFYQYDSYDRPFVVLVEKYDNGDFKKGTIHRRSYNEPTKHNFSNYNFLPDKLWITEHIKYDKFFRKAGKENSDEAVRHYLLNRKGMEIIVKNKEFEKAMTFILQSLEKSRGEFDYSSKEINGKIKFKISDKGTPEDITVNGEGITEKEKNFIVFYLSKFKEIEMPAVENVAFESYHTIYMFSINVREFFPAGMQNMIKNDLFFSMLPKESVLSLLRSKKRELKKYIREEFQYYW